MNNQQFALQDRLNRVSCKGLYHVRGTRLGLNAIMGLLSEVGLKQEETEFFDELDKLAGRLEGNLSFLQNPDSLTEPVVIDTREMSIDLLKLNEGIKKL